jgi:protocatechuate 3,4-dioxygenase beta subunit
MSGQDAFSRRRLLQLAAGAFAAGTAAAQAAEALRATPRQTSGPFYPLEKPLDIDADLTLIEGRQQRAEGDTVLVTGRVLNIAGEPVSGARIEVWQANARGRYTHPDDGNTSAPLDPNFEGFASLVTDKQGQYRFRTIKPGAYPAGRSFRPPHIHFDVKGRKDHLITQMYFPGEPLNEKDSVIAGAGDLRDALIARMTQPTGTVQATWLARWDIVLERG